jgi:hypothetical protein
MEHCTSKFSRGWTWVSVPGGLQSIDKNLPAEGQTIADHLVVAAPASLEREAKALVTALTDPAVIGMDDVRSTIGDNVDMMAIIVGSKK